MGQVRQNERKKERESKRERLFVSESSENSNTGNQRMPWVSMNDVLRVVEFVLTNDKISGPVVVAEEKTITNYEFTKTLGKILNRPTLVWTPEFLLKLIAKPVFGELVEEGLLSDLETFPKKLTDNGFYFEDTNLERYLKTQV